MDDFLLLTEKGTDRGQWVPRFRMVGPWVRVQVDKTKGGSQVEWVGYRMDFNISLLGVSRRRATWLAEWLLAHVAKGKVDVRDIQAVLGRLCLADGPLEYTRPFPASLYDWLSAIHSECSFALPWSISFSVSSRPISGRSTGHRS